VVEQSETECSARVTGSLIDFMTEPAAVVERLSDPAIRIVSLTITKGCYFVDPTTCKFDSENSALLADAASPDCPKTVFGMIVAGLRRRRAAGVAPFTVLSCDNILHNGNIACAAVVGMAGLIDAELADWVRQNVAFPNGNKKIKNYKKKY
jgi:mannitol 2-dehydrogenase